MSNQFIRIKTVLEKVPLSRSTIWRLERAGNFPKRVKLSKCSVAWNLAEIEEWISKICEQGNRVAK